MATEKPYIAYGKRENNMPFIWHGKKRIAHMLRENKIKTYAKNLVYGKTEKKQHRKNPFLVCSKKRKKKCTTCFEYGEREKSGIKRKEAYLVDGRILFVELKVLRSYGESINISALILMRGRL